MATTLAPVLNELVAPCRRTPFPSESYWKCSRSGRTTVQPIGSEHPSSGRGASPALDTHRRGRRIQHSPRICLGIPIAFRQEERHEATTRTRAPEPKSLSHQTNRRSCSSETCAHGKFANDPVRTAVSSGGRNFVPLATRSASRGGAEGVRPRKQVRVADSAGFGVQPCCIAHHQVVASWCLSCVSMPCPASIVVAGSFIDSRPWTRVGALPSARPPLTARCQAMPRSPAA